MNLATLHRLAVFLPVVEFRTFASSTEQPGKPHATQA
jgi:hypothetical protein